MHIVDATLDALAQVEEKPQRVGVIATKGTLTAGWYQERLAALGMEAIVPTPEELEHWFVPGCYAVKRGALNEGGELLTLQANALFAEVRKSWCWPVPKCQLRWRRPGRLFVISPGIRLRHWPSDVRSYGK